LTLIVLPITPAIVPVKFGEPDPPPELVDDPPSVILVAENDVPQFPDPQTEIGVPALSE
jgi:hypothetical protein